MGKSLVILNDGHWHQAPVTMEVTWHLSPSILADYRHILYFKSMKINHVETSGDREHLVTHRDIATSGQRRALEHHPPSPILGPGLGDN